MARHHERPLEDAQIDNLILEDYPTAEDAEHEAIMVELAQYRKPISPDEQYHGTSEEELEYLRYTREHAA